MSVFVCVSVFFFERGCSEVIVLEKVMKCWKHWKCWKVCVCKGSGSGKDGWLSIMEEPERGEEGVSECA